jgi:hypothetical protein
MKSINPRREDYDIALFNCEHIATFLKTGMCVEITACLFWQELTMLKPQKQAK